jgi:hypothetical protein
MSEDANEPEVPNVAADKAASPSPVAPDARTDHSCL